VDALAALDPDGFLGEDEAAHAGTSCEFAPSGDTAPSDVPVALMLSPPA
jgi:hypothetical protein